MHRHPNSWGPERGGHSTPIGLHDEVGSSEGFTSGAGPTAWARAAPALP